MFEGLAQMKEHSSEIEVVAAFDLSDAEQGIDSRFTVSIVQKLEWEEHELQIFAMDDCQGKRDYLKVIIICLPCSHFVSGRPSSTPTSLEYLWKAI